MIGKTRKGVFLWVRRQLQIPIYPVGSKNISELAAVNVIESKVEYIVNGLSIFSHKSDDVNSFGFITCNFIVQGLCKQVEVQRCFHVSPSNIALYLKKYREKDMSYFFSEKEQ